MIYEYSAGGCCYPFPALDYPKGEEGEDTALFVLFDKNIFETKGRQETGVRYQYSIVKVRWDWLRLRKTNRLFSFGGDWIVIIGVLIFFQPF